MLWSEFLCAPKIHGLKPTPQDVIRGHDLWEVVSHEDGTIMDEISALIRAAEKVSLPLPPGTWPKPTWPKPTHVGTLILDSQALQQ